MIRVKAGVFSVTPPGPADDDGSYLQWHLLDHMPEQYQLPGVVHATRWIADGDYVDARLAGSGELADIGNVVNYLVGDPVAQTLDDFIELGARLAETGRFPERRPSIRLSALALLKWYAAPRVLVSPEVVPFRPHRGVVLVVEEPTGDGTGTSQWLRWLHADHHQELLDVAGVAGVWMYGSTRTWKLNRAFYSGRQYVTVIYVDDDPLTTAKALASPLEGRWQSDVVKPLFAGPFRSMVQWEAWR